MSEAILKERKFAKFIVRQAITRLNLTIKSMDLQWEGCIASSNLIYHAMDAEFAVPLGEQMDYEVRETMAGFAGVHGVMTCAETVQSVLAYNELEQEELEMMEYASCRIAQHRLLQEEQQTSS
jgi:hypothetical protein